MTNKVVICHYAEIALKGRNRKYFEERLVENIKKALGQGCFKSVKKISGRILVQGIEDEKYVQAKLVNVFGLSHFSFAVKCSNKIEEIKEKAVEMLGQQEFETFRVSAQRSDKTFALTSQEINEQVGAEIVVKLGKKVKLENPDKTLFIEVVEKNAFLFFEKIKAQGGLPIGVSSKAICLLSGGIDSPVSAYLAMKRGVEVVFSHFHAVPYSDKASVDKVKDIVKILNKYQIKSKIYLIPLGDIQKEILLKTEAKFRVILYRRMMFKISEQIAKTEKAKALITGENLGQVASQTMENMAVIENAVDMPVLKPLITMDKQEIIEKAKQIGTYDISILPHQDCCSRFLPKHPATRATLREIEAQEKKLDVDKLIQQALKQTKVEVI